MKKFINPIMGTVIGIINILVGSCGGLIAVEALKRNGIEQKKSHATAIAIILPLTLVSAYLYVLNNKVKFNDSIIFIIPGLIGAISGSFLLKKIPEKTLRKVFAMFIIYAGVRMFVK